MDKIRCQNVGRKFGSQWIFKDLSTEISSHTAILGPNGSGKSTLIKALIGSQALNTGNIQYTVIDKQTGNIKKLQQEEELFKHLAIAAPYISLIEEFTTIEMVEFYWSFKPTIWNKEIKTFLETINLWKDRSKFVTNFSSGMKQRLKLALALYSDVNFIFLDEPTTNLDSNYKDWYFSLLAKRADETLFIIASNDAEEYKICNNLLNISTFK